MKKLQEQSIAIIGLGLIGGSIARALKKTCPQQYILAVDENSGSLTAAMREKIVDETGALAHCCAKADIVVIALPPLKTASILQDIESAVRLGTVVTDVASVKSHIMREVESLGAEFKSNFIPGHPIAGSEKSGFFASNAALFQNRNVILTPVVDTSAAALAQINAMWRATGAHVLGMSLQHHDRVLAATSHLPHLLAFAIVDVLLNQKQSEDIFRYAAGGFADFSRLASSDAQMWSDIFIANAAATESVLEDYINNLEQLRQAISSQNHEFLMRKFQGAKRGRDEFINKYFSASTQQIMTNKQLQFRVEPGGTVAGSLRVPGDKSISHRSIIFAAIANGVTRVSGFLEGEDALNTLAAFRELGVTIVGPEEGNLTIYGVGKNGLQAPRQPLYMGNSGTAMRLLAGLLAAQNFDSVLTGDESLNKRPMRRVADPLRSMGATIETEDSGSPPLRIHGGPLQAIEYHMPMASAQVKSCLLLAGLYAEGVTRIYEPAPCRDHTERMLTGFGYDVKVDDKQHYCEIAGGQDLQASDIDVPADISSAAFFMVAAAITPGATVTLEHVGVNPTRTGVINILQAMGADITLGNERVIGGEPVADIVVKGGELQGIDIDPAQIPLAIDEFPVIFVAAACARGVTTLRGAEELRVKESDRIAAMETGLNILGIETESYPDGIRITGGTLGGGKVDSCGDHRIAMAFAVAGLRAKDVIEIDNCNNVATSFPGFVDLAAGAGLRITQREVQD